ncbi:MAG: hypothetical protein L0Y36_00115 [Planctomycetales bacterium]|nr:hypothetical protein [Planctomycetales bacterium]
MQRYSLRSIWDDLALPDMACSFKLALGLTKIILAFSGVLGVCTLGVLMDICSKPVVVHRQNAAVSGSPEQSELDVYIVNPSQTEQFIRQYRDLSERRGVFSALWTFATGRFHAATLQLLDLGKTNFFANIKYALTNVWLCVRAVGWAFRFHPFFSMIYFSAVFLIVVFMGGALCRCSALEFAQEEKPGLTEAIDYTIENYRSFLSAPLLPLGLVGIVAFMIAAAGTVGAIPFAGELILMLLFGVLLLCGFLIALLILGTVAGGLLLFPAVAYEKTTGLDSIGRAFSYVLNRPIWMFYYVLIAGVFGTFFYLIIRLVVFGTLRLTYGLLSAGMTVAREGPKLERIWPEPSFLDFLQRPSATAVWSESAASFVVYGFMLMIVGLLIACIISYFFSASTIIYALMRKKADNVEMSRIYVHLEQVKE